MCQRSGWNLDLELSSLLMTTNYLIWFQCNCFGNLPLCSIFLQVSTFKVTSTSLSSFVDLRASWLFMWWSVSLATFIMLSSLFSSDFFLFSAFLFIFFQFFLFSFCLMKVLFPLIVFSSLHRQIHPHMQFVGERNFDLCTPHCVNRVDFDYVCQQVGCERHLWWVTY